MQPSGRPPVPRRARHITASGRSLMRRAARSSSAAQGRVLRGTTVGLEKVREPWACSRQRSGWGGQDGLARPRSNQTVAVPGGLTMTRPSVRESSGHQRPSGRVVGSVVRFGRRAVAPGRSCDAGCEGSGRFVGKPPQATRTAAWRDLLGSVGSAGSCSPKRSAGGQGLTTGGWPQ